MQIPCTMCGEPIAVDEHAAGSTLRCPACGKSFVAPDELALTARRHTLNDTPVASLVLFHYLTGGLYSLFHLNQLHDRLPKLRANDPSATSAIGLCFVPIVNFYWFFFTYHRLCVRINEQRRFEGLAETAPRVLVIPVAVLHIFSMAAPLVGTGGFVFLATLSLGLMPVFAALVQASVNDLVAHTGIRPPGAVPSAALP